MTIKETFDYLKNDYDFSNIKLVCTKEIPKVYCGYYLIHDKKTCIRCGNNKPCEYIELQEWYKFGYFPISINKKLIIDYIDDTYMRLLDTFKDLETGKELVGTWDIDIEKNIVGEFEIIKGHN